MVPLRSLSATAGATALALGLSGCLFGGGDPEPTETLTSPSPTSSPSPASSATPSPNTSASPTIVAPGVRSAVTPEISFATVDEDAGLLVVEASVPGIVEDGGTCIAVAQGRSETVTLSNAALANVSVTACGQFYFELDELPSGTVSVVVTYGSASATGDSAPLEVELP